MRLEIIYLIYVLKGFGIKYLIHIYEDLALNNL